MNKLHLFDLETVDESLVGEGIDFDKTDVLHNLTLFLYPDDSDRGRPAAAGVPAVLHGQPRRPS